MSWNIVVCNYNVLHPLDSSTVVSIHKDKFIMNFSFLLFVTSVCWSIYQRILRCSCCSNATCR